MMRIVWRASAVLLLGVISTLLVAAQAPNPAPSTAVGTPAAPLALVALDQLEPGQWQLESKDQTPRLVCLVDGRELIQLEHDQNGCSRFVVANDPKTSTVHYSCPASGWGRTTVRVETSRLAQVQTQGIAKNAPFDLTLTAKRVGACGK